MGGMGMRGAHGIESTTGNFSIFNAINARNAVDEAGISEYIMLDKEKLLEIDPEYIFIDGTGLSLVYEDYAENAEFYNGLQAFKNNNVYMHMPYNYYYTNLGVAIADSYYIGSILYPEEFDDIDPGAKLDEIITTLLGAEVYEKMAETYYGGYQNLTFE
jgi:iron complex transport system substrate-binding protein